MKNKIKELIINILAYIIYTYRITKQWFIKEGKIIGISFGLGLITITLFLFASNIYSENMQKGIADNVLRLHVIANSDSLDDQELKLEVRNDILNEFSEVLSSAKNTEESEIIINENLYVIEQSAEKLIKSKGYNYTATATIGDNYFPTKKYGDYSFPAGKYQALKVEIGEAKGENWWCVMFPPLCFVDATKGDVIINDDINNKIKLEDTLTAEQYDLITNDEDITIKTKFKMVEWWNTLRYED